MAQRLADAEDTIERGERPIWLFTLKLTDGRSIRASTRPVEVPHPSPGDGPYQYGPFLDGIDSFEEEIDVFGLDGVGALTQARVELATTEDLAALQDDWHAVVSATAELALLWPGQRWDDRQVVLDGATVQSIEFGIVGEPTSFSLETTPPSTSGMVGDDDRDVGTDYPAPLDKAARALSDLVGSKYVHVYGDPDSVPGYKIDASGVNNRLLIAGHRFPNTGTINVFEDGAAVGGFTPINTTNASGDICILENGAQFDANDGAYTYKANNGGISAGDNAAKSAINASGVLRRLLVDSGLEWDHRRMEPTFQRLSDWRVGFYVDQEANAIDLIRDRLLPYLPLVELASGDGIWFAYVDPQFAPIEAHLIVGQNLLGRAGRMYTSDLEAIRNSFAISFDYDAFAQVYRQSATLGAVDSMLCYLSQQILTNPAVAGSGVRADDVIDCNVIWDLTTARRVLNARASRLALPRRICQYEAAPDAYWIEVGMVVALTHDEYGIDAHRAVVTSINRSMHPFRITIELVDRTPIAREVR